MKTQVQSGKVLELTAPAAVTSGAALMIGGLLVIPIADAANGEKFSGVSEGVHLLPKKNSVAVFVEGEVVYWDDSNKQFDEKASGFFGVGTAVRAAGATDATVTVKLVGHAVVAEI